MAGSSVIFIIAKLINSLTKNPTAMT